MKSSGLTPYFFYLFFLIFLINGCGKKGDPLYKRLIIPEPLSELSYSLRPEGITIRWHYPETQGILFEIYRKEDESFIKIGETRDSYFNDDKPFRGERREYIIVTLSKDGFRKEQRLEIPSQTIPEAPQSFNFKITEDGVLLYWSSSENCLYNIYKITEEREVLLNKEPLTAAAFKDNPDPSSMHTYGLRCKKNFLEGHPSKVTVRPEDYIPGKPEGLRFAFIENKLILTWKENPEIWIKGYRIYRSTEEEFLLVGETNYPFYMDEPGFFKKLLYRVTALGPAIEGPFSDVLTIMPEK